MRQRGWGDVRARGQRWRARGPRESSDALSFTNLLVDGEVNRRDKAAETKAVALAVCVCSALGGGDETTVRGDGWSHRRFRIASPSPRLREQYLVEDGIVHNLDTVAVRRDGERLGLLHRAGLLQT